MLATTSGSGNSSSVKLSSRSRTAEHLVVVAAVQFHLGQFDDAVGDPEAGDVRCGVLVVAARREEAAQLVAAEFGHDHADDAAAPALDLDARVAPVGRQVAAATMGARPLFSIRSSTNDGSRSGPPLVRCIC